MEADACSFVRLDSVNIQIEYYHQVQAAAIACDGYQIYSLIFFF